VSIAAVQSNGPVAAALKLPEGPGPDRGGKRRGWDSNPRRLSPRRFSRPYRNILITAFLALLRKLSAESLPNRRFLGPSLACGADAY
jgi:hypothetical protein